MGNLIIYSYSTHFPIWFQKPPIFQAKGISVESFLKKQEEIAEKFDSGFNGYRGLNGKSQSHNLSLRIEVGIVLKVPVYPKLITLIFRSLPQTNGHCYRKFIL